MQPRKLAEGIYWMGSVDWDRRLFDALVPLPDGTSYNAYLIQGSEKTALLDTADPAAASELFAQLETVPHIDYVVSHHAEQDHSGALPRVLERYPQARLVCSPKAQGMLQDLLPLSHADIVTVEDGETLSLGDRTLRFIHTPWVHWPETLSTYLEEDRILFSCDFFGSHIAASDLFVTDEARVYEAAKRYYAEIMMPFRAMIQKNMDKLASHEIEIIAPSHGQVYPRASFILDAYREWIEGTLRNRVLVAYVSMHDSTRVMVEHLVAALVERGVEVEQFDLTVADTGKLAMALVDAASVVIGTPTVLAGPHPLAASAAFLVNALRPRTRFLSVVGSYGWGGRTVQVLQDMLSGVKAEFLDPVMVKGFPRSADVQALEELAARIAARHAEQELG